MTALQGKDRWIKCISTQGNIRGVAIHATELINHMAGLHQVTGVHMRGLGEAAMGALLLGSYCKPGERVNLNIQGTGYFQQALVDAYPDGACRGYVIGRDEPIEPTGEFVSEQPNEGPWGNGVLSVLRSKGSTKEQPYIGTVPLITGHLAKDLSFYWVQSEQVPSAVGLAVNVENGKVTSAGGFLIQALPGATAEEVKAIERHINELQSLADSLTKDADPLHLLSQIFQDTAFIVVEERPLRFECNCSWKRVERALALVGTPELRNMLAQDNAAIVRCDFCAKEYTVDAKKLEEMISAGESAQDEDE